LKFGKGLNGGIIQNAHKPKVKSKFPNVVRCLNPQPTLIINTLKNIMQKTSYNICKQQKLYAIENNSKAHNNKKTPKYL
jgi:hypothetical protein